MEMSDVLCLCSLSDGIFGPPTRGGRDDSNRRAAAADGPLSPEGLKQQRGYNIWAKTVNQAGGIKVGGTSYKVEIVYNDYESNTPRAVQSAERLITRDKVNFLFSPYASGATKAASSLSERYQIPTISAMASSPRYSTKGTNISLGAVA